MHGGGPYTTGDIFIYRRNLHTEGPYGVYNIYNYRRDIHKMEGTYTPDYIAVMVAMMLLAWQVVSEVEQ